MSAQEPEQAEVATLDSVLYGPDEKPEPEESVEEKTESQTPERSASDGQEQPEESPGADEGQPEVEGKEPGATDKPESEESTESESDLSDEERFNRLARERRIIERRLKRDLEEREERIAELERRLADAAPTAKRTETEATATSKIPELPSIEEILTRDDVKTVKQAQGILAELTEKRERAIRDAAIEEDRRQRAKEQRDAENAKRREAEEAKDRKNRERLDTETEELRDEFKDYDDVSGQFAPWAFVKVPGTSDQLVLRNPRTGQFTGDPNVGQPVLNEVGNWIKTKPGGLRVGYHLQKNPELASEIEALPVDEQYARLLDLRKQLLAKPQTSASRKTTRRKNPADLGSSSSGPAREKTLEEVLYG